MEMKNKIFFSLTLAGLCLEAMAASPPLSPEQTQDILHNALLPPHVSYTGKMMIVHWFDHSSRAEEVIVSFSPPHSERWEFLNPDGSVSRVVLNNNSEQHVLFPGEPQTLKGNAAKSIPKKMSFDDEWNLLLSNYEVNAEGSDVVAGRDAWSIRLNPKSEGKPIQTLSVDKGNYMILATKRYRPSSRFAISSRFTHLDVGVDLAPKDFQFNQESGSAEDHGVNPDFMSGEEIRRKGAPSPLPDRLKDGFVFESGDFFQVHGHAVKHLRYTDGMDVISVFETRKPVRFNASSTPFEREQFGISETGQVYRIKSNGVYYTFVGDLSQPLLKEMSLLFR